MECCTGYQKTNHPNVKKRLMDSILSNKDQAVAMGIDETGIKLFMP
jgi:ribose 5-phosphate isomerase RpiB